MISINFSEEITNHIIWNIRLRCFLDGGECITEKEALSHSDCTLGRWIYREGIKRYGTISEVRKLEKRHADLHSTVRSIIQMKESGMVSEAEKALIKLKSISEELISLISAIEPKIKSGEKEIQYDG